MIYKIKKLFDIENILLESTSFLSSEVLKIPLSRGLNFFLNFEFKEAILAIVAIGLLVGEAIFMQRGEPGLLESEESASFWFSLTVS